MGGSGWGASQAAAASGESSHLADACDFSGAGFLVKGTRNRSTVRDPHDASPSLLSGASGA